MEIPEVIRVSEISYKNVNKKERDFAMMTKYCHQIKEMLKATPQFLRDFRKPILINPMEYMRNLRVYGLQKTEEGTDYTMMQD